MDIICVENKNCKFVNFQETAYREINCIVGSNPEKANIDSLTKLKYLDMCIKDVLRLFPISPFIIRQNEQYFQIGYTIITTNMLGWFTS